MPPLTASFNMELKGLHRVRRSAGGRKYEYWYAWRGGPQILKASGAHDKALEREVTRLTPAAVDAYRERTRSGSDSVSLRGLITRYLVAMEANAKLAPRTKSDRRKHLDIARTELGHMEVKALESRKARPFLIDWRNKRAKTPKTADDLLAALSAVFFWATDQGELTHNPVKGFERIYEADRSTIIWEPHHLELFYKHADPEVRWAVALAAATGLRRGDCLALPWTAIKDRAIVWQTGKSRKRRTVVIPITQDIRTTLDAIPRRAVTVLTNSDGLPWTPPGHGLGSGIRRARVAALAEAKEREGKAALSGLEGLHFHDLRGTATTRLILAGIPKEDVCIMLGWKPDEVDEIIRRYVADEAMAKGLLLRYSASVTAFTGTV